MPTYNGHRSWNAWNVSLWIHNDEYLYRAADDLVKKHGKEKAALFLFRTLKGMKTPDGAIYNLRCVREAVREWQ